MDFRALYFSHLYCGLKVLLQRPCAPCCSTLCTANSGQIGPGRSQLHRRSFRLHHSEPRRHPGGCLTSQVVAVDRTDALGCTLRGRPNFSTFFPLLTTLDHFWVFLGNLKIFNLLAHPPLSSYRHAPLGHGSQKTPFRGNPHGTPTGSPLGVPGPPLSGYPENVSKKVP